jgi:hypothetical protein
LARAGDRLVVPVSMEQVIHEEAIREFRRLKIQAEVAWEKAEARDA